MTLYGYPRDASATPDEPEPESPVSHAPGPVMAQARVPLARQAPTEWPGEAARPVEAPFGGTPEPAFEPAVESPPVLAGEQPFGRAGEQPFGRAAEPFGRAGEQPFGQVMEQSTSGEPPWVAEAKAYSPADAVDLWPGAPMDDTSAGLGDDVPRAAGVDAPTGLRAAAPTEPAVDVPAWPSSDARTGLSADTPTGLTAGAPAGPGVDAPIVDATIVDAPIVDAPIVDAPAEDSPPELGSDDAPDEILPWDRKPLMVAIGAALVLVLIGVLSGVASAAFLGDGGPRWQASGGAQPSSPTPGPSQPGGPVVPDDAITLSGVGDVIMGTLPGDLPPNDGKGFFDPVKEALAADLVMGNLETPLTTDTGYSKCAPPAPGEKNNCFQFHLDQSYANHLVDGGFDLVNLANNHTNDMGPTGLSNTRAALDAAGVKHTGKLGQITYVEVKGIKVAVLGFSPFSSSGKNLLNIGAAKTLVKQAAAEADLVVIQMQGGAEGSDKTHVRPGHEVFSGEDRGDLIAFAHAVVDAGADVVFGHGPHIMRGMEFYKGRLIAYSLGNFCGYGVLNSSGYLGVGGVLKVTLKRDGTWVGGTLIATEMVKGGMVATDAENRALGFVNGLSKTDFGGAGAIVSTTSGEITAPSAA